MKRTLITLAVALSAVGAAHAQSNAELASAVKTQPVAQQSLSRAEVLADLAVWREAGMSYPAMDGLGVPAPYHAEKLTNYQRLRSGQAYQDALSAQQQGRATATAE